MPTPPPASRENKDRLTRLLHAGRSLTLDEVASTLGVTERTARRTLRALAAEDLPIRTRFVDGHKLHYLEEGDRDAPLQPVVLTEREALALAIAAEVATPALESSLLAAALASARSRLLAATGISVLDPAEESERRPARKGEPVPVRRAVLEAVRQAIREKRSLTISYTSMQGQRAWGRVIDPYLIATVNASWHVVARDHHHGQVVHFPLGTIDEATVGEAFQPSKVAAGPTASL
jgi:predicted DNA-binding transcriptional regulator YafY